MRIVVASCVFPPEPVVSAKTSHDIATHLLREGHDVKVVCPVPSRNVKGGWCEDDSPFLIDRLFSFSSRRSSLLSRFLENISFGVSLFFYFLFSKKVDVVYANVWPIFSTGLLVLVCKIRGVRVVLSIQDMYPESLVAQGRVRDDSWLVKALLAVDRWIIKESDKTIVISEGFRDVCLNLRKGREKDVSVIKNWVNDSDIAVIAKSEARASLAKYVSLSLAVDDVLCVYGGNIGVASGLDSFVKHIGAIDNKVKFLFAGDGALVPVLKEVLKQSELEDRVQLLSPWPIELTSSVYCAADILLLPTAEGQEFASVPSKLITYMLSSRPVLLIASEECESAKEIGRAECGYVLEDRSVDAIVSFFDRFSTINDLEKNAIGASGRAFAERYYASDVAVERVTRLLVG